MISMDELTLAFLQLAEVLRVHLEEDARERGVDTEAHGPTAGDQVAGIILQVTMDARRTNE